MSLYLYVGWAFKSVIVPRVRWLSSFDCSESADRRRNSSHGKGAEGGGGAALQSRQEMLNSVSDHYVVYTTEGKLGYINICK